MFAMDYRIHREGVKLQAPRILAMVQQALQAPDADLQKAFLKLESDLQIIPEAIDKASALELLKSKFRKLDDAAISAAYDVLRTGLYDARKAALEPLSDAKERIEESERFGKTCYTPETLRRGLLQIQKDLQEAVARRQQ